MIILDGKGYVVPGLETLSWLDNPKRIPKITKTTPRKRAIQSIFVHTTRGMVCKALRPGGENSDLAFAYARSQVMSKREASWDFTVNTDGVILQQNDPVLAFSWHATQVNPYSIGIEMVQEEDGTLHEDTIHATAVLVTSLCEELGLQKQTAWEPASDRPYLGRIERMDPGFGGADCVGIHGHRNVWTYRSKDDHKLVPARGPGDPNSFIFERLVTEHRFEKLAFHGKDPQDLRVWKGRQKAIGFQGLDVDGIPGPKTTARLKDLGYVHGLWVDALPAPMP